MTKTTIKLFFLILLMFLVGCSTSPKLDQEYVLLAENPIKPAPEKEQDKEPPELPPGELDEEPEIPEPVAADEEPDEFDELEQEIIDELDELNELEFKSEFKFVRGYEKYKKNKLTELAEVIQNVKNPKTLTNLLKESLVGSLREWVKQQVAKNPYTPTKTLANLADSWDEDIRLQVATNPSTPFEVLAKLAEDRNPQIRLLITKHPSVPPKAVAKALEISQRLTEIEKRLEELKLEKDQAVKEKKLIALAETIQSVKNSKVLEHLDWEYDVEGKVFLKSWVLQQIAKSFHTPMDLLADLAENKDVKIRLQVAKNPNTSPEILTKLAKDEDYKVKYNVFYHLKAPPKIKPGLKKELIEKIYGELYNRKLKQVTVYSLNQAKYTFKFLANFFTLNFKQAFQAFKKILPLSDWLLESQEHLLNHLQKDRNYRLVKITLSIKQKQIETLRDTLERLQKNFYKLCHDNFPSAKWVYNIKCLSKSGHLDIKMHVVIVDNVFLKQQKLSKAWVKLCKAEAKMQVIKKDMLKNVLIEMTKIIDVSKFLFSIEDSLKDELDQEEIPEVLSQKLQEYSIFFPQDLSMEIIDSGNEWLITTKTQKFQILKKKNVLKVYQLHELYDNVVEVALAYGTDFQCKATR